MTGCNVCVNGQSVLQSGLSGGAVPRAIRSRLASDRKPYWMQFAEQASGTSGASAQATIIIAARFFHFGTLE